MDSITPRPSASVEAAEGAAEGAEAVAVGGADEEEVVVAVVLGARPRTSRTRAVGEARSRRGRRSVTGAGSRGTPSTQIAALAALGRVVDALDQVPGDAAAVGGAPDPGRPVPAGVAGLVAGRFVVDAPARDRAAPPRHLDRALDRHPGPLAGPAPAARRWGRSIRSARPRRAAGRRAGRARRSRAGGRRASPRGCRAAARCGRAAAPLAVPEDPEALAGRPDLGARRAEHQLSP